MSETRWGPRLARLYSVDVKRLEAQHAAKLMPDASTWGEAVEALFKTMRSLGPVKGSKLIKRASDYLGGVGDTERIHYTVHRHFRSRAARLMFFTFSYGRHPDPAVPHEEGLTIALHIIVDGRKRSMWTSGVPLAFISRHAMNRLYERSAITENADASTAFAVAGMLGYLTHLSDKHADSALNLLFDKLILTGGIHRCTLTLRNKRPGEIRFFDVRTVLPEAELGDSRYAQIEQAKMAASAVRVWLESEDIDERAYAEAIPYLPRRADNYPTLVRKTSCA